MLCDKSDHRWTIVLLLWTTAIFCAWYEHPTRSYQGLKISKTFPNAIDISYVVLGDGIPIRYRFHPCDHVFITAKFERYGFTSLSYVHSLSGQLDKMPNSTGIQLFPTVNFTRALIAQKGYEGVIIPLQPGFQFANVCDTENSQTLYQWGDYGGLSLALLVYLLGEACFSYTLATFHSYRSHLALMGIGLVVFSPSFAVSSTKIGSFQWCVQFQAAWQLLQLAKCLYQQFAKNGVGILRSCLSQCKIKSKGPLLHIALLSLLLAITNRCVSVTGRDTGLSYVCLVVTAICLHKSARFPKVDFGVALGVVVGDGLMDLCQFFWPDLYFTSTKALLCPALMVGYSLVSMTRCGWESKGFYPGKGSIFGGFYRCFSGIMQVITFDDHPSFFGPSQVDEIRRCARSFALIHSIYVESTFCCLAFLSLLSVVDVKFFHRFYGKSRFLEFTPKAQTHIENRLARPQGLLREIQRCFVVVRQGNEVIQIGHVNWDDQLVLTLHQNRPTFVGQPKRLMLGDVCGRSLKIGFGNKVDDTYGSWFTSERNDNHTRTQLLKVARSRTFTNRYVRTISHDIREYPSTLIVVVTADKVLVCARKEFISVGNASRSHSRAYVYVGDAFPDGLDYGLLYFLYPHHGRFTTVHAGVLVSGSTNLWFATYTPDNMFNEPEQSTDSSLLSD